MCGQSFINLSQEINVLYSTEQQEGPLGSQALAPDPPYLPYGGLARDFFVGL